MVDARAVGEVTIVDKASKTLDKIDKRTKKSAANFEKYFNKASRGFRTTAIMLASWTIFQRTFAKITRNFREFEEGMAMASTVIDTATVNMAKLEDQVISLRMATGRSFKELTEGLSEAVQRGIPAGQAAVFLGQAHKFATAAGMELKDAVKSTTVVLDAYALGLNKSMKVMDTFFALQDKGNVKIAQLSDELGKVVPTAAQLNVSFEEVSAAIVALTRAGMSPSEAITRLNNALLALARSTPDAQMRARALGIDFTVSAIKAKGLAKFVEEVNAALGENKEELISVVPRIRAFQGISIIAANDAKLFKVGLESVADAAGRTNREFEKASDTISYRWKKIGGLISAMSAVFMRGSRETVKRGLDQMIKDLSEWFVENRELIESAGTSWAIILGEAFKLIGHGLVMLLKISRPVFFNIERGVLVVILVLKGLQIMWSKLREIFIGAVADFMSNMSRWGSAHHRIINKMRQGLAFFGAILFKTAEGYAKLIGVIKDVFGSEDEARYKTWALRAKDMADMAEEMRDIIQGKDEHSKGKPFVDPKTVAFFQNQLTKASKATKDIKTDISIIIRQIEDMTEKGGTLGFSQKDRGKVLNELENLLQILDHIAAGGTESKTGEGNVTKKPGFWKGFMDGLGTIGQSIEDLGLRGQEAGKQLGQGMLDAFETFFLTPFDEEIKSIGQAFQQLGEQILRMMANIAARQAAMSVVSGLFDIFGIDTDITTKTKTPRAKGGYSWGWPVRKYDAGGIVGNREISIKGEGSRREAVVPLADGRTIPVKLEGGGGNFNINLGGIQVNGSPGDDNFAAAVSLAVQRKLQEHGVRRQLAAAVRGTL